MSNTSTVKRGGMTKEQIAFQEAKNEEDFKNHTNLSLNDQRNRLVGLKEDLDSLKAILSSDKVDTDIKFDRLRLEMLDLFKAFQKKLDDFDLVIRKYGILIDESKAYAQSYLVKKDEHHVEINLLKSLARQQQQTIEKFTEHVQQALDKVCYESVDNVKRLREEILSRPSEVKDIRKEFDEKLELVTLNGTNSVLRSTNCEKHLNLIEKKIENIYQLIKQLELRP